MDISIIITSFNYASYIEESIESCLSQAQNSLQYEVIVIDDGSTDDTQLILEKINSKLLRKFKIKNSGIEVASNFGFSKALGKYIVRVDADDKLLTNYLQCIYRNLNNNCHFYYSDYQVINSHGKIIGNMKLPRFELTEIRERGDFLATGTLYSAEVLKNFSYYSVMLKNSGLENYDLILRLLEAGILGKHIPEELFCYRRHNLNLSVSKEEQIIKNGNDLFRKMGLGIYRTNKNHPYNPNKGLT